MTSQDYEETKLPKKLRFISSNGLTAFVKKDVFRFSDSARGSSFKRYYKSDWQGIVVVGPFVDQAQIYTLDCRTTKDGIDEMLALFPDQ